MHITVKVVIITPTFTGEFTETQLCELACSTIELAFKFAMPCCKYCIIHSFFSLLFVQYFYLNKNVPGSCFFFFNKFIYLFIYFWLCWVFVSVRGLSLVAASGGHSSSRCADLSLSRPLLLRSTGSRRAGSVVVAHGPSCSAACGIFPDQGSNPCALHWQADSQPLCHQGSPQDLFKALEIQR